MHGRRAGLFKRTRDLPRGHTLAVASFLLAILTLVFLGSAIMIPIVPVIRRAIPFSIRYEVVDLCLVAWIPTTVSAVTCAHIALRRMRHMEGAMRCQRTAKAGIAVASVGVAVFLGFAILAASSPKEHARRPTCKSYLRQLGLACHVYAMDNDDHLPDKLSSLYPDYISSALWIFECPSTDDRVLSAQTIEQDGSYVYVGGLIENSPPDTVLMYDKLGNHQGRWRNVLYKNGEVKRESVP